MNELDKYVSEGEDTSKFKKAFAVLSFNLKSI